MGKPVTLDSRYDLLRFSGITAPALLATKRKPPRRQGHRSSTATTTCGCGRPAKHCCEKLGKRRASGHARQPWHGRPSNARAPSRLIPVYGTDEIADVTGAGDTVIGAFTLALASGATPVDAATLANMAGGIVVMKRGTATVTREELVQALGPSDATV